jgi:membrane protein DedA with SNARE-associated domain
MDWIRSQPFALAALFLTAVAAVRSQCTYWLGRGVRAGVIRAAWAKRLTSDNASAGVMRLEKWGWPCIPVSFLTVGLQTAVNLSAGLIGWRWPRYTAAAVPGWIAWGCVYAAGGLAAFAALAALATGSPRLAAAVIEGLVCVVVGLIVWGRQRRLRRQAGAQGS